MTKICFMLTSNSGIVALVLPQYLRPALDVTLMIF